MRSSSSPKNVSHTTATAAPTPGMAPVDFSLDPYVGYTYRGKPIAPLTGADSVTSHIDTGLSIAVPANGVITYGFFVGNHAVGPVNNPHSGEGKGYSPFSDAQKVAATAAIQLWDDLIPQTFVNVGDITTSRYAHGDATIVLANTTTGPAQAWAYYPGGNHNYQRVSSDVWTATPEWNPSNAEFHYGEYGNTTLVHELGHTLGLSHPGAYNFGPGFDVNYANGAEYAQDSYQYSIMSYWNGYETGQLALNWNLGDSYFNYPEAPQLHDIFVIQEKYGADPTTRAGATTYGFNSTAGNALYDFGVNQYPFYSIYDAGGNDTIDASGFNVSQFIDLHAGAFSSIGGAAPSAEHVNAYWTEYYAGYGLDWSQYQQFTDAEIAGNQAYWQNAIANRIAADTQVGGITATEYDNVSIAYGTIIENAIGGSARDLLVGNEVGNVLKGMGGDDVLQGNEGNDTLIGGTGNDTLYGGAGNDTFVFAKDGSVDTIKDFETGHDKIDLRTIEGATAANTTFNSTTHVLAIDVDHNGTTDVSVIVLGNAVNLASDVLFHA